MSRSASGIGPALAGAPTAEDTDSEIRLSISPIDLDGPAIAEVTVTIDNASRRTMTGVRVTFDGPVGWMVAPETLRLRGIRRGRTEQVQFQIRIPSRREGFYIRTFTATVRYAGGDGAGTATTSHSVQSGEPLPDLAAAFNNVGVTHESDPGPGDFDGDGNSFSAEKLADQGVTPGAGVSALGAELTWPAAEPGTPGNVAGAGQAIQVSGSGSRLVMLGSGSSSNAVGNATVYYSDGTSSSGSIGFPNWSVQDENAHGATLVVSTVGRNRPDGYGNADYRYRVFANAMDLDPAKTVELVVLPANGSLHVFAMGFA